MTILNSEQQAYAPAINVPGMGVPAILAQGLRKTYGEHVAVKNLNLSIRQGEIVGFLGPNGAGKTTTLKMLTGLLKPTAGSAQIMGHDIEREPVAAKTQFGYVPDTPNLYGKLAAGSSCASWPGSIACPRSRPSAAQASCCACSTCTTRPAT